MAESSNFMGDTSMKIVGEESMQQISQSHSARALRHGKTVVNRLWWLDIATFPVESVTVLFGLLGLVTNFIVYLFTLF